METASGLFPHNKRFLINKRGCLVKGSLFLFCVQFPLFKVNADFKKLSSISITTFLSKTSDILFALYNYPERFD